MIPLDADPEVLAKIPALREFVDAVNARDKDLVEACLVVTDPRTLAVLAAGWVGELLDQVEKGALKVKIAGEAAARVGAAERNARAAREEANDLSKSLRVRQEELAVARQKITSLQGDLYIARRAR